MEGPRGARQASANGYREVTVKTTAGPVTLSRPKLRGTAEAFASRLSGAHVTRTSALESLVIASFVRGLPVRDVEAALAGAPGDQAAISKSAVSSVCQAIKEEYAAWARRRLDEVTLDYLYLDASFFRMHPGSPAEPVLAAWGITTGGKPAFTGLAPGSGESADAWGDFLTDLKDRGLASPLLVISDGAPGLIAAIEQAFPQALRQRCLVHRSRNILAKVPAGCCRPRCLHMVWQRLMCMFRQGLGGDAGLAARSGRGAAVVVAEEAGERGDGLLQERVELGLLVAGVLGAECADAPVPLGGGVVLVFGGLPAGLVSGPPPAQRLGSGDGGGGGLARGRGGVSRG